MGAFQNHLHALYGLPGGLLQVTPEGLPAITPGDGLSKRERQKLRWTKEEHERHEQELIARLLKQKLEKQALTKLELPGPKTPISPVSPATVEEFLVEDDDLAILLAFFDD